MLQTRRLKLRRMAYRPFFGPVMCPDDLYTESKKYVLLKNPKNPGKPKRGEGWDEWGEWWSFTNKYWKYLTLAMYYIIII